MMKMWCVSNIRKHHYVRSWSSCSNVLGVVSSLNLRQHKTFEHLFGLSRRIVCDLRLPFREASNTSVSDLVPKSSHRTDLETDRTCVRALVFARCSCDPSIIDKWHRFEFSNTTYIMSSRSLRPNFFKMVRNVSSVMKILYSLNRNRNSFTLIDPSKSMSMWRNALRTVLKFVFKCSRSCLIAEFAST